MIVIIYIIIIIITIFIPIWIEHFAWTWGLIDGSEINVWLVMQILERSKVNPFIYFIIP